VKKRSVKLGLCSKVKHFLQPLVTRSRTMNISQLAKIAEVSTDTVRYYEKQGLISVPERQDNGYRRYTEAHAGAVRFVRGAQALGFSLAEIRAIVPQLAQGASSGAPTLSNICRPRWRRLTPTSSSCKP
jgi:DNA-binding transcriptional MerR regulator